MIGISIFPLMVRLINVVIWALSRRCFWRGRFDDEEEEPQPLPALADERRQEVGDDAIALPVGGGEEGEGGVVTTPDGEGAGAGEELTVAAANEANGGGIPVELLLPPGTDGKGQGGSEVMRPLPPTPPRPGKRSVGREMIPPQIGGNRNNPTHSEVALQVAPVICDRHDGEEVTRGRQRHRGCPCCPKRRTRGEDEGETITSIQREVLYLHPTFCVQI